MSQIEAAIANLRQLPEGKVAQAAAFIHNLRDTDVHERQAALRDTAGCMSSDEADEFEQIIEEGCERIDPD